MNERIAAAKSAVPEDQRLLEAIKGASLWRMRPND
jgi:hypothetical protein